MSWIKTSLLLCVFGVFKEFRPSDPFLVNYLTGPWKNFTQTEVYQEIYPVSTYSNLATLLPVLLLTDILRYKPIIIVGGLSGCCAYTIMVSSQRLWGIFIAQFFYGLGRSSEVAYFSYIYAKVDKEHFQAVSSHTKVAVLVGKSVSNVTAQIVVSLSFMNYQQLFYFALLGTVLATTWAFFLPSVSQSVYFHRNTDHDSSDRTHPGQIQIATIQSEQNTAQSNDYQKDVETPNNNESSSMRGKIIKAYHLLWKDFLIVYSNCYLVKWSAWWIIASCGALQTMHYSQSLWSEASGEVDSIYNGVIRAIYTISGALAAFAVGKLRLDWSKIGEAMLSIFSIIQGILILIAARTDNIWISYTVYVGFAVMYQAMITIASAEVAKNIPKDSYGLIFGTNNLMVLVLQSALTFAITGKKGFALTIRSQFLVYAGYFIILGVLFMAIAVYTKAKRCRGSEKRNISGTVESILSVTGTKTSIS